MITQNSNPGMMEQNGGKDSLASTTAAMSENVMEIIWRGRWIVLLSTIAVVVAAIVYIMNATPIYTSTSRVYVEQSGPKIVSELEEGVMTQSKNYLYTQAALMRSKPVLSAVLSQPGVASFQVFNGELNKEKFLSEKGLRISVGRKDDILSVSSDSPNPVEAAQLVNAVVDAYITYHNSTKRQSSGDVLAVLHEQKAKSSQELSDKLKAMMEFKRENEALAYQSSRGNVILQRLERLSEELTKAQMESIESQAKYETAKELVGDPAKLKQFVEAQRNQGVYTVGSSAERARLLATLEDLQMRLADRRRQLNEEHPAVVSLETEVGQVQSRIDELDKQFASGYLTLAEKEYEGAKQKEAEIKKYFEEQRSEVLALNEQEAEFTILQSEYEQLKEYCDMLDGRMKEVDATEEAGVLNIRILEVGEKEDEPSKPEKAKILALAMLFGLALGCGLAVIRNLMDQRLRSAEEISAVLAVPTLGVVPSMSRKLTVATRGRTVHLDSTSPIAESYRTIRTAVFFSVPKGQARTILITSPSAGDGKSTLVSNLCIAMAQAGQRVLVMDADFRKPMQHAIFEMNREPGVSSVIAGGVSLEEAIQRTGIAGLDILPCGPDVPNPSEMLNSEAFSDLMEELTGQYDRVIVDAPPVIPVTDACILGAVCDVTLLVLRAEKSTRKTAQQARDGLISVGARILGIVVNDVNRGKGRYGYYYSQGYYGRNQGKEAGKKQLLGVGTS